MASRSGAADAYDKCRSAEYCDGPKCGCGGGDGLRTTGSCTGGGARATVGNGAWTVDKAGETTGGGEENGAAVMAAEPTFSGSDAPGRTLFATCSRRTLGEVGAGYGRVWISRSEAETSADGGDVWERKAGDGGLSALDAAREGCP